MIRNHVLEILSQKVEDLAQSLENESMCNQPIANISMQSIASNRFGSTLHNGMLQKIVDSTFMSRWTSEEFDENFMKQVASNSFI